MVLDVPFNLSLKILVWVFSREITHSQPIVGGYGWCYQGAKEDDPTASSSLNEGAAPRVAEEGCNEAQDGEGGSGSGRVTFHGGVHSGDGVARQQREGGWDGCTREVWATG